MITNTGIIWGKKLEYIQSGKDLIHAASKYCKLISILPKNEGRRIINSPNVDFMGYLTSEQWNKKLVITPRQKFSFKLNCAPKFWLKPKMKTKILVSTEIV